MFLVWNFKHITHKMVVGVFFCFVFIIYSPFIGFILFFLCSSIIQLTKQSMYVLSGFRHGKNDLACVFMDTQFTSIMDQNRNCFVIKSYFLWRSLSFTSLDSFVAVPVTYFKLQHKRHPSIPPKPCSHHCLTQFSFNQVSFAIISYFVSNFACPRL